MDKIEFIRKVNVVLVFVLLVAAIVGGGYVIARSGKSHNTIPVSIDSVHLRQK